MAEAFCRALGRDVECHSAGSGPASCVRSKATAAINEAGSARHDRVHDRGLHEYRQFLA